MLKHNSIYCILLVLYLFSACDSTEFVPAKEPVVNYPAEVTLTGDFNIRADITDSDVHLYWDMVKNAVNYDIIVNDSMYIEPNYDQWEFNKTCHFRIIKLAPDTEYKITVRAYSKDLNVKLSSGTVRTKKQFVVATYNLLPQQYAECRLSSGIKNSNGDYVVIGCGDNKIILLAINENLELLWINEFSTGVTVSAYSSAEIQEDKQGNLLLSAWGEYALCDAQGNLKWKKKNRGSQPYCGLLADGKVAVAYYNYWYNYNKNYPCYNMITELYDGNGNLLYQTIGDTLQYAYMAQSAVLNQANNLLVFNTIFDNFEKDVIRNIVIEEFTSTGKRINKTELNTDILPYQIFNFQTYQVDNHYYLLGNVSDFIGNSLMSQSPFFVKLDNNLQLLEYKHLTNNSYRHMISQTFNQEHFFCLINPDSHNNYRGFMKISKDGQELSYITFPNFPLGFAFECANGQVLYFSQNGLLILINPDGYIKE